MQGPHGYLVIDLDKSTEQMLWVRAPSEHRWYGFPVAAVTSVRPVEFADGMNLKRVLCEVNFK